MSALSPDIVKAETCESMLITKNSQFRVKVYKFYMPNFSKFVILVSGLKR
jgi:hypothetical protein